MDILLKSLKFLALDCQATTSSPKTGHLLEIGWLVFGAKELFKSELLVPETFLVRPPEGFVLPTRITKLTGINETHMSQSVSGESAFEALNERINMLIRKYHYPLCPAVIHYARYEMAWIKHLHRTHGISQSLPFEVLCTHQIASRVLPHLPRKGLRAVAGYLGHSVPLMKRCAAHTVATAYIWCKLIERLADVADIHTLSQLQHWLNHTKIPAGKKRYPMPRNIRLGMPRGPGVYRMKRSNGDILYIGKAKSLKQRVNSYFQNIRHHSEKTLEMLTQAIKIDHTNTPSVMEAALLEADEIKQFSPPYNVALANAHRKLVFISRNFAVSSSINNATCRLGPVPTEYPFVAAHSIIQHMSNDGDGPDISETLSMPIHYCPNDDCFQSGLALFKERFGAIFKNRTNRQAILHIGRLSWLKQWKAKAPRIRDDDEVAPEPETPSAFVWTPDAVFKTLESICRRCGFLLRRARWLIILSESTVVWETADDISNRLNVIQLSGGKISNRYDARAAQPIPLPENHGEPFVHRQTYMNLETYDRLRVLTTELRRLLTDNRLKCIRLGKKSYLYPPQMQVLFKWI